MSATASVDSAVLDRLLGVPVGSQHAEAPAGPSWLSALRAAALERVGALKLPTRRDEDWRFTDLSALAAQSFQPAQPQPSLALGDVARFFIGEATSRLVFIDGVHAPQWSSTNGGGGGEGVVVTTLAAAIASHGAVVETQLGRHAAFDTELFTALNTAFLQDAAVIIAPPGAVGTAPVHVLFIARSPGVASHPRLLLVAEAGSAVTLIEDHVALHDGAYFTNPVAEIVLAANARVEHVRVQRDSATAVHLGTCAVALGRASHYHSVSVALGATLSRLGVDVALSDEAAQCSLDGMVLIGASQIADTHSCIRHLRPRGTSRQLHKAIVDGAAHAVFNGRVEVGVGAQQTDSAQSSRNLLLSAKGQVDTLPQLEILADDVKCTHGATVGELDSEEVFYLRSRGLSEAAARDLLIYAFGAEVIDRIPVASLRRQLERSVLERTARHAP
ncbi:MAG: Fe-S cluster assembly protein SufD [Burkholderiaceae bacterium]